MIYMKYLLLAIVLTMSITTFGQGGLDVYMDKDTYQTIYKGKCSFDQLLSEQNFTWLRTGPGKYKPDDGAVKYLSKNLKDYSIVVLMGTWCEDTQELLPQVYKLLQLTAFPMEQYVMYGLDMEKKGYANEEQKYNVESVPTIILMQNGKEVGRIVETVNVSLEKDLQQIISDHKAG